MLGLRIGFLQPLPPNMRYCGADHGPGEKNMIRRSSMEEEEEEEDEEV